MIDNYLLEYLVAFAETNTIAGAADQLNVTQPTVSRGLSKLEDLLDVKLFDRQPQKITLTVVGKFAAQRAASLLQEHRTFNQTVRNFALRNQYQRVGATNLGPLFLLEKLAQSNPDAQVVFEHQAITDNCEDLLVNHEYSMILNSKELATDQIESRYVGREALAIKITKFNPLYHKKTVTFADLKGNEFVLSENIGDWREIIEREIADAQFLYQRQESALRELIRYSNFPIFKTNITRYLEEQADPQADQKRKYIPITDEAAQMPIYASYLKENKHQLTPLILDLSRAMDKVQARD